jgi:hypothetical protein
MGVEIKSARPVNRFDYPAGRGLASAFPDLRERTEQFNRLSGLIELQMK